MNYCKTHNMLLKKADLPDWFDYPTELSILMKQNLLDFDPWVIITDERLVERYKGLKKRYPERNLIPFARREDNDDLACFEKGKEVVVIHDFASAGFEGGKETLSFWDWFRMSIDDMIEYNSYG